MIEFTLAILSISVVLFFALFKFSLKTRLITSSLFLCLAMTFSFVQLSGYEHEDETFNENSNSNGSLLKAKSEYSFTAKHTQKGNYEIEILVDDLPMSPVSSYEIDFEMTADFYQDGERIHTDVIKEETISPFWRRDQKGFTILRYEVPDYCPLDKDVEVKLKVINPGINFEKSYLPQKIVISKGSDK